MEPPIATANTELERLATSIQNGWSGDQTFQEAWGWNCPPLTRHDLAGQVRKIAASLSLIPSDRLDAQLTAFFGVMSERIQLYITNTLPNLWGGNNGQCVSVLDSLLSWISSNVAPYFEVKTDWTSLEAQNLLPKTLAARLRGLESSLNMLGTRSLGLGEKISVIETAYAAAESLPTDLQSLADARLEIDQYRKEVQKNQATVSLIREQVGAELGIVQNANIEASRLVQSCEDAYSAATTKGLGESFSIKAAQLSRSMWIWVGGLFLSLAVGTYIGHDRVTSLQVAISAPAPSSASIFANLITAILGVAAPVWFAWVATKQLGQRFRLAEDYGYKASVAKAYEGYRREADRLDPQFASRLFSSALDRIEEPPLRLVENESHGSPLHEIADKFRRVVVKAGPLELTASKTVDGILIPPSDTTLKVASTQTV